MKRILIATPALDQKVDCYYVHSLCESIKLGARHNLEINAVFLANESILPMARNELFYLAVTQNYDAMVFIDDDEKWQAQHLIEILQMEQDVITVPVVNKGDRKIEFNVTADITQPPAENGLIPCAKTGTGFLKLTRCVFMDLWNSNMPINFRGKQLRLICEYGAVNGDFMGEDIALSNKIYTGTWTPPRLA